MLVVSWKVPQFIYLQRPTLVLKIIYWNYTESTFRFPLDRRLGYACYYLLNEEFAEKKGLLTYSAEIVTEDGDIYKEWKHQLWVKLIHVGEENDQDLIPKEYEEAHDINWPQIELEDDTNEETYQQLIDE